MKLREICQTAVATIEPDKSVREATWSMRENHVGDLVVVAPGGGQQPVGLLTDRDIIMKVVAEGAKDLDSTRVEDVMSEDLVAGHKDDTPDEAIETMQLHGVRRLPLLDDDGEMYGIITLDDMLSYLTHQMAALSAVVGTEIGREVESDT